MIVVRKIAKLRIGLRHGESAKVLPCVHGIKAAAIRIEVRFSRTRKFVVTSTHVRDEPSGIVERDNGRDNRVATNKLNIENHQNRDFGSSHCYPAAKSA